jgi:carboxylesterase type B
LKVYLGPDDMINLDPGVLLLDPSEPTPDIDPRTSEDCLFLDVYTPKYLLDEKQKDKVPVMVWIHGGGYTAGSKTDFAFAPDGFYNVSDGKFILVSMNYRLGTCMCTCSIPFSCL